jgi:glycosyltransferase involved in cell wall biosynthesis
MRKNRSTIRVAVVAPSMNILGGQAVQALRLIEGLRSERGFDASLLPINPGLPGPFASLQKIKYLRTVITSILYAGMLFIRLPRFDVVHIFSASYFSFLLAPTPAILIAKLYRKPVILNYHSGEAEDHLERWRRVVLPVFGLADRIVVPSGYLVAVFARFNIEAEAVFNTVNLDEFAFRDRRPLRPVLLSNRNLEKRYNVECVLRAFRLVQRRAPESRLIVAGDGAERSRLEKLVDELGLAGVEFAGAADPREMPGLYSRADIFVNASVVDNMPLSIIEAFAAGLPVVTSDAGGIPYLVSDGENGLLVSQDDCESLARAVLTLLDDGDLAERLIAAARADSEKYTWKSVRKGWKKIHLALAGAEVPARIADDTSRSGREKIYLWDRY